MDPELQAYDEAWRNTDKATRNAVCQGLADAYVQSHPELKASYGGRTIPELVALLEIAREEGDEERRIQIDIWINAAFEYQTIGGEVDTSGILRGEGLPSINVEGSPRGGQ